VKGLLLLGIAAVMASGCGSSQTATPQASVAAAEGSGRATPGSSEAPPPTPSGTEPVASGAEPVLTHGTVTGHSTKVSNDDRWTYKTDLTIKADLLWNDGLDNTSFNATKLTAATYTISGSASGHCTPTGGDTQYPMAGSLTKEGTMSHKVPEEDLSADSHIMHVGILMATRFKDGLANIKPIGSLWVPLECDGVYTDRMSVDPCELDVSILAPGVLDGSCASDTSDEFGPVHTEWTAHFAP
jgi:hypothetical protein